MVCRKTFKVSIFDFTLYVMPYSDKMEVKSEISSRLTYLTKEP